MASRRRVRQLSFDGQDFAWHAAVVGGACYCEVSAYRLRVWGGGKAGQVLRADLVSTAWLAPPEASVLDGGYPTPSRVRTMIEYAVARGWDPTARGGSFILTEADHAHGLVLPGFAVTDRLRNSDPPGLPADVRAAARPHRG
jgi:hypothetical protein